MTAEETISPQDPDEEVLESSEAPEPRVGPVGSALVIVAGINTLISLYYYLRVVVQMTLRDDGQPVLSGSFRGALLVNVCAVALVLLLVFSNPLKTTTDRFSRDLVQFTAATPTDTTSVASALEDGTP